METQNYQSVCPECLTEKCNSCETYKETQTLEISLNRLDAKEQIMLLNHINSTAARIKMHELENQVKYG
jgi:hypothetical protein